MNNDLAFGDKTPIFYGEHVEHAFVLVSGKLSKLYMGSEQLALALATDCTHLNRSCKS